MVSLLGKYNAVLYRQGQRHMTSTLKDYDLGYTSCNFLFYIWKNPGFSQKDICRELAVDEAMGTRMVRQLVQKGFLYRERDERYPHSYALFLTDQGKGMGPKIQEAKKRWWSYLTEGIGEDQLEILMNRLSEMADRAAVWPENL